MKNIWKKIFGEQRHKRGLGFGVFLAAGAITGVACVAFMWAFEFVLRYRLDRQIGGWHWIVTPLIFLISVEIIRRTAPYADGAGIP